MRKVLKFLRWLPVVVFVVLAVVYIAFVATHYEDIAENQRMRNIPTLTPTPVPLDVNIDELFSTFGAVFPAEIEKGLIYVDDVPYRISEQIEDLGGGYFIKYTEEDWCFSSTSTYVFSRNLVFTDPKEYEGEDVNATVLPACNRWFVVVHEPTEGIVFVDGANVYAHSAFGNPYVAVEEEKHFGGYGWHYENGQVWFTANSRSSERDAEILRYSKTFPNFPAEIDGPIGICSYLAQNWFALGDIYSSEEQDDLDSLCDFNFEEVYSPNEFIHFRDGGPQESNLVGDVFVGYGPHPPGTVPPWFNLGKLYPVDMRGVKGTIELVEIGEDTSIIEVILQGKDATIEFNQRFTVPKGHYIYVVPYLSAEINTFFEHNTVYQIP